MSGWIAVKRGMSDHPVMRDDFARVGWFVWMIENAVWKDTQIDIGGRPHTVPRGSLCFSQRFLAERFKASTKAVRTFLADLERHKIITTEVVSTGHGTKTKRTQITLCNYDKYQATGNKTEPRGKQKGNEEEQVTNIPVGEADKSAPSEVVNFEGVQATVWRVGRALLARHGINNVSIIGKWLKESKSATEVLAAIEAAERAQTEDPIPYIAQTLRGAGGKRKTYGNGMTHDEWLEEALS